MAIGSYKLVVHADTDEAIESIERLDKSFKKLSTNIPFYKIFMFMLVLLAGFLTVESIIRIYYLVTL